MGPFTQTILERIKTDVKHVEASDVRHIEASDILASQHVYVTDATDKMLDEVGAPKTGTVSIEPLSNKMVVEIDSKFPAMILFRVREGHTQICIYFKTAKFPFLKRVGGRTELVLIFQHSGNSFEAESISPQVKELLENNIPQGSLQPDQITELTDYATGLIMKLDQVMSLMHRPPKFIKLQDRKSKFGKKAQRKGWIDTSIRWTTVTCNAAVQTPQSSGQGGNALHYARAHWRRSKESHPASKLRKDQEGYWTWIRGTWRGDPAYGVVLHNYSPSFNSPKNKLEIPISISKDMADSAISLL